MVSASYTLASKTCPEPNQSVSSKTIPHIFEVMPLSINLSANLSIQTAYFKKQALKN